MRHAALLLATLALAAWLPWWAPPAWSQTQTRSSQDDATEALVKAAYLLRFGGYVEWPASAFEGSSSPLVIGILGSDAVADSLAQTTGGRTVNGRPVEVRRLRRSDLPSGVHILFAARPERARIMQLMPQMKGQPILIVGDDEDFVGASINFVIVDNRVRFDVSLPASDATGCKISSRLLGVARKVNNRPS